MQPVPPGDALNQHPLDALFDLVTPTATGAGARPDSAWTHARVKGAAAADRDQHEHKRADETPPQGCDLRPHHTGACLNHPVFV